MFAPDLFSNQVVLVTGGGSGIGAAIARMFLQYGARTVYIGSRKPDRIGAAVAELSKFGDCRGLVMDIRKPEDALAAAEQIKTQSGKCDILINNAGGQFPSAAENISINGWNAVINNNLNGTWYMTQTFAKELFIPQKHGIVLTIIAQIFRGFPGMVHTGAARAGIENMTMSLAVEWAPHNIRINALAPGIILSSGLDQYPPEFLRNVNHNIPMKRMGSVDEIAYSTLFLCSPMSTYTTGECLYVDGGQRLWGSLWEVPDPKS